MKKIMFNDKCSLTDAVLKGRKTMTRRIAKKIMVENENQELVWNGEFTPAYKVGEVVAVAQSYSSFRPLISHNDDFSPSHPGWSNKMFVRADLMPHQIRITDIKVERLQDISEEDCMREGIVKHTPFPIDKNNPRFAYNVNEQGLAFKWFGTPQNAFADLFDEVSGRDLWKLNPYVFAYTFELVK